MNASLFGSRSPWSLLDDLVSWQDGMNRLFDRAGAGYRRAGYPPVNVWASDDQVVLDFELPGVDPKKVDIAVRENALTVSGEVAAEEPGDGAAYVKRERGAGRFERTLELPIRADADKVKAGYRNGILRVTVPRAEADKPRRIAIQAG